MKKKCRVEIETVENGYEVVVWKHEHQEEMYPEPKKFVAEDIDSALDIAKAEMNKKPLE